MSTLVAHHEETLAHQFRASGRRWSQITLQVFVDLRVLNRVDAGIIRQQVEEILRAHVLETTRIEVVPYQWVWDENFASVAIAIEARSGIRYFVYSLKAREGVLVLVPFEGLVEY